MTHVSQPSRKIDDPIRDYVAFLRVTYKRPTPRSNYPAGSSSQAGLPNAMPELVTWLHSGGDPPANQTALVASKFPDYDELRFLPGSETQYSSFGYMVLGALIKKVSGQTYEEYVLDHILLPLGMENTNFVYTEPMAAYKASRYATLVRPGVQ